jgi:hypothetical protein
MWDLCYGEDRRMSRKEDNKKAKKMLLLTG